MACHVTKININKQPNKQNLIILFNKNLKAFETIGGYLYNYMHTYDPCVLLHVASLWHMPKIASHLSDVKFERKKDKKKYMNKYQLQI